MVRSPAADRFSYFSLFGFVYTWEVVSKVTICALLLLFASDIAQPLFPADPESSLPACCRRGGKHHCAMTDMASGDDDGSPKLGATPCPAFPGHTLTANTDPSSAPPEVPPIGAPVFSHPAAKAQTEARYRISHSRAREKRGPPSLS